MYLWALLCSCTLVAATAQGRDFGPIGKDVSASDQKFDIESLRRVALRSPYVCYTYTTTYLTTFEPTQYTHTR